MVKILCIIPARSGSKGVINKNIKYYNGKPLLAWSIEQAIESRFYEKMRIIVSTDSEKYRDIAIEYGAEVPFLRPIEISGDLSTDYECIKHCIDWLKENDDYIPDIILQLRPTSPERKIETIDKCIEIFLNNIEKYDSLRTVVPFSKSPYKMYTTENNVLKPLFNVINDIDEPYNQCRQILPKCYLHNGYIDIIKTTILNNGTISGNNIYPFIMEENDIIDIDEESDWIEIDDFEKNGYTICSNIFDSKELDICKDEIMKYYEKNKIKIKINDGSIPDFIGKVLNNTDKLKDNKIIHKYLKKIFGDSDYRFCSHNDIGINRVVGWHKDKLNGEVSKYEEHDIWNEYKDTKYKIVKLLIYLEDHSNDNDGLQLVPGSHLIRDIHNKGRIHLHPKKGDAIIFDQRITHRGQESASKDNRILISFGFGKNNIFTDEFEKGTVIRQNNQNKFL
jgi:CMP-N-acetylneuraminic acid synthetase/ectoine hydroxylase-related dioxygenase (phytanoyl-CoA dioxygenase family)